ncbi:IST1-like protein, partial [Tanacetum coccineum]|nr:IST1-like protein [Tanacetum cinerariifolium]
MGRKLDALLGRKFKTSKFKATVNLAVSRLAVLKNQRQARLTLARSDIVQLLSLGHHEHALLR